MTPMIDVIFLLLIFFVCTASFQRPEQVLPTDLSLPGAISTQTPLDPEVEELEEVVIEALLRDGQVAWRINERELASLEQVRQTLMALVAVAPEVPVILDIEPEVPIGNVIDLYDLCHVVGFDKVHFAASAELE